MLFYGRVFLTFFRNSLIREMMFPANFLIQVVTRLFWFSARVALFGMIYGEVDQIQEWSKHEYFAFMATGILARRGKKVRKRARSIASRGRSEVSTQVKRDVACEATYGGCAPIVSRRARRTRRAVVLKTRRRRGSDSLAFLS